MNNQYMFSLLLLTSSLIPSTLNAMEGNIDIAICLYQGQPYLGGRLITCAVENFSIDKDGIFDDTALDDRNSIIYALNLDKKLKRLTVLNAFGNTMRVSLNYGSWRIVALPNNQCLTIATRITNNENN